MSPRKTILRELRGATAPDGTPAFVRPTAIGGFQADAERFQKAVNQLLADRLIEGKKDDEGRMTVALNAARRTDADRELRPLWSRPAVWAAVGLAAALAWFVMGVGAA